MRTIRRSERTTRRAVDRAIGEEAIDHQADQERVCDGPRADARTERPGEHEHEHRYDDVRRAERQRRVLGDALLRTSHGESPRLGLEQEHDPEGEERRGRRGARPSGRRRSRGRGVGRAPGQRYGGGMPTGPRLAPRHAAPPGSLLRLARPPCDAGRRELRAPLRPRGRGGRTGPRQRREEDAFDAAHRWNQS